MVFAWFQRATSPTIFADQSALLSPLLKDISGTPEGDLNRRNLNYGVELEYVLAFHELELDLTDTFGRGPDHGIEKNVPLALRRTPAWSPAVTARLGRTSNLIYNSWGILENNVKSEAIMRPYDLEPQSIVLRKLNEKVALVRNKVQHRGEQESSDKVDGAYNQWIVATDRTVVGQGSANLYKWLPRLSSNVWKNWDSYGIEVISRVLGSNNVQDRVELEEVVNTLKGDGEDLYEGFITNQCALQVHVEVLDLDVLKELAGILLIYEEEISKLHPRCRRPGHRVARSNLTSNRTRIFLGPNFVLSDENTPLLWDQRTTTSLLRQRRTIQQIRDEISKLRDETEVAEYMCFPGLSRLRVVNFRPLTRPTRPSTIEFRQARGSLDIEDVTHWVDFCVGLVQLAEHYFHNPDARIKNWAEDVDVDDNGKKLDIFHLLEEMQFDEETMRYWQHRIAKYMVVGRDEDERSDIENIPTEKKTKSPSKTPSGPGARPGGAPLKSPPDGRPPRPPGGSKDKTSTLAAPLKPKPTKTILPPVPPLYSPTTPAVPSKTPKPIETPSKVISPRKLALMKMLEAKDGSNKPFFDVDTAEGSTIPPPSPVHTPAELHISAAAPPRPPLLPLPPPSFSLAGLYKQTSVAPPPPRPGFSIPATAPPLPPTSSSLIGPDSKTGTLPFDPRLEDPFVGDDIPRPEDFYTRYNTASDPFKATGVPGTVQYPDITGSGGVTFATPGRVGVVGDGKQQEKPETSKEPEKDLGTADTTHYMKLPGGRYAKVTSFSYFPGVKTIFVPNPNYKWDDFTTDSDKEPTTGIFTDDIFKDPMDIEPIVTSSTIEASSTQPAWDDEEQVPSDDEFKTGILSGNIGHPIDTRPTVTSSIIQPTSSKPAWDDEEEVVSDEEPVSRTVPSIQKSLSTTQAPVKIPKAPVKSPKAPIKSPKVPVGSLSKQQLEELVAGTFGKTQAQVSHSIPTVPISSLSLKRHAEDLSADKKDGKKQKPSPKSPRTPGSKPTGQYSFDVILDVLNSYNGLPQQEFERRVNDLYDTTQENKDVVSRAVAHHAKNHRIPLPSHVPGHSDSRDTTIAQKIQNEWRPKPDTSGDEAFARMLEAEGEPPLTDEELALILARQQEEEEATRRAGSRVVAQELIVKHPPLTKFGPERLDTVNAGTVHERLRIQNFRRNEWDVLPTPASVSGRFGQCGAAAVANAMRHQYPNEPWTRGLTPENFLRKWVDTVPRVGDAGRRDYYDEEQLNNAVQRLTNGQLQIAVVHEGLETQGFARNNALLTANGERARYLYLHLIHSGFRQQGGVASYMHWEAMSRKRGVTEHK
ncbi:hypothetical protein SBOR_5879 [Sclerotinia borealis F-4128]|uniref:Uncharacterized protein n=1 Tax=Sclerotinia borealis (strain F-4128) TaxID=1432307 RepID=W9CAE4_SCLBF|nr:hypothetical protein SBOR_5879 [Sclerotinia borealis F-4128]